MTRLEMRMIDANAEYSQFLVERKFRKETNLCDLTVEEKVAKLVELQIQLYTAFKLREDNGGPVVPEQWKKWHRARCDYANSVINNGRYEN